MLPSTPSEGGNDGQHTRLSTQIVPPYSNEPVISSVIAAVTEKLECLDNTSPCKTLKGPSGGDEDGCVEHTMTTTQIVSGVPQEDFDELTEDHATTCQIVQDQLVVIEVLQRQEEMLEAQQAAQQRDSDVQLQELQCKITMCQQQAEAEAAEATACQARMEAAESSMAHLAADNVELNERCNQASCQLEFTVERLQQQEESSSHSQEEYDELLEQHSITNQIVSDQLVVIDRLRSDRRQHDDVECKLEEAVVNTEVHESEIIQLREELTACQIRLESRNVEAVEQEYYRRLVASEAALSKVDIARRSAEIQLEELSQSRKAQRGRIMQLETALRNLRTAATQSISQVQAEKLQLLSERESLLKQIITQTANDERAHQEVLTMTSEPMLSAPLAFYEGMELPVQPVPGGAWLVPSQQIVPLQPCQGIQLPSGIVYQGTFEEKAQAQVQAQAQQATAVGTETLMLASPVLTQELIGCVEGSGGLPITLLPNDSRPVPGTGIDALSVATSSMCSGGCMDPLTQIPVAATTVLPSNSVSQQHVAVGSTTACLAHFPGSTGVVAGLPVTTSVTTYIVGPAARAG